MSRVEVLLATMHRESIDFLEAMNIQTDCVVANQANGFLYSESVHNGNLIKLVTTDFRGVGRNRNIALCYSTDDILLFADDDMTYYQEYENTVEQAFAECPNADIILFDVDETGRNEAEHKKNDRNYRRVGLLNFSRYGTYNIAIRTKSLKRARLSFSELFGGGSIYGSGEDSLFLRDALKAGLRLYFCPKKIAIVDQSESTWFRGYNDKFMFDKGALIASMFPVVGALFSLYFIAKFSHRSDLSMLSCAKLMRAGMHCVRNSISYNEYVTMTK